MTSIALWRSGRQRFSTCHVSRQRVDGSSYAIHKAKALTCRSRGGIDVREAVVAFTWTSGGSRSGDSLLIETFWRRMKELGYIEGQNISAEYRFAEGVLERLPTLAAEVVRL